MITLKGISYRSLPSKLQGEAGLEAIAEQVVAQRKAMKAKIPNAEGEWLDHHVCSTILRIPFNTDSTLLPKFLKQIEPNGNLTFINEYECASWAFSLAWLCRQYPTVNYVMLTLVDHGLLALPEFDSNPAYGRSSSGTCVIALDVSQFEHSDVETGLINSSSPASSLLTRLRILNRKENAHVVLPFFPEPLWENLVLAGKGMPLLPNRHSELGHCFGADPWLSIALREHSQDSSYFASSIALNGYKAIVKLNENLPAYREVLI
jgi:hypothetical protein